VGQRDLNVDGLANARDLGGLERNDGTWTPARVFFRTEALDRVTDEGWHDLRGLGVRTVIDLRRPEERTRNVPDDIHIVDVDLDGDEQDFWAPIEADGRWATPLYYLAHLAELPHRMRAVLDAVAAASDGAVLFHCGAGWDRTGLLSAVLLRSVDVTTDAATADYVRSFQNAEALAALHGRASQLDVRLEVLARFGHTPESAFRAMYDSLDVDGWLASADVAPATREAVRTWRGAVA
jgi:protein-tyrosine phosphatase